MELDYKFFMGIEGGLCSRNEGEQEEEVTEAEAKSRFMD